VNKCPKIVNRGYPVGWHIPSLTQAVVSSPASINVNVGASVTIYIIKDARKDSIPQNSLEKKKLSLFNFLN